MLKSTVSDRLLRKGIKKPKNETRSKENRIQYKITAMGDVK
jgi:hypothetical protein